MSTHTRPERVGGGCSVCETANNSNPVGGARWCGDKNTCVPQEWTVDALQASQNETRWVVRWAVL